MSRLFSVLRVLCVCATMASSVANATGEPSEGAKGIPGAKGTFEFKPEDFMEGKETWWKDSDGIDPGKAGCHIGTDSKGEPNGRLFGEACSPEGLLVETNPGPNELHSHKGDIGHPDYFDCNAWCIGQGASKGSCEVVVAPPCQQSAMCACN